MNISLNYINIQGKNSAWKNQSGSVIKASPQKTIQNSEAFKALNFMNKECIIDMGSISFIKYEMFNRLGKSVNYSTENEEIAPINSSSTLIAGSYDEAFIEDLALEYYNCKNEIIEDYSGEDRASMMKLLKEVYNDVVNDAAKSLSGAFEYFFDYSSNSLAGYKMADEVSVFNRQEFENNIRSFAKKALETVDAVENEADPGSLRSSVEKNLNSIKEGSSIEAMSYNDVKTLAAFLKTLPKLMPGMKTDMHGVENIMKEWNKAMIGLENSCGLSNNVRRQAISSMKNNIHAYHMVASYVHDMNGFAKTLERLMNEFSRLAARYNGIKEGSSLYSETNNFKTAQLKLKLESEITNRMKNLKDQIEAVQKQRDDLAKNPRKIVESETYKSLGEQNE